MEKSQLSTNIDMNELRVEWCTAISQIKKNDWDIIFSRKKANQSYEFHNCINNSRLDGVNSYILKISIDNDLVALIPSFSYRTYLDSMAPHIVKKVFQIVRKRFKNFATAKALFLGSPISICDHLFGIKQQLNYEVKKKVYDRIFKESKKLAKQEKCALILIKELPQSIISEMTPFLSSDFFLAESYPNSFIAVGHGLPPFPALLKSHYKRKITTKKKTFEKLKIKEEISKAFCSQSNILLELYRNVRNKSNIQFENLNEMFFELIGEKEPNSFTIKYYNDENNLICYVLILEDEDSYTPLYIGIDYEKCRDTEIYFNCVYRIVELAEKNHKKWVSLGQTSYDTKKFMGAIFERLYLAIHVRNCILHYIMAVFKNVFFPPTRLPQNSCLKSEYVDLIFQRAKNELMNIEKI